MRNLNKTEVFDRRFEHYLQTSITYTEAYRKVEGEYEVMHGRGERKYKSFRSFKTAYNERNVRKLK